jgi:glyoxylase-like metal-dependent hydrolase (beta-lactamase superfamily II)
MTAQIDRIEGRGMRVNAFLVHGPDGVVLVDGMLTVSDAALVRQAIDDTGHPLAGVVVTHPHPDHYAGLAHLVGTDDVASWRPTRSTRSSAVTTISKTRSSVP